MKGLLKWQRSKFLEVKLSPFANVLVAKIHSTTFQGHLSRFYMYLKLFVFKQVILVGQ